MEKTKEIMRIETILQETGIEPSKAQNHITTIPSCSRENGKTRKVLQILWKLPKVNDKYLMYGYTSLAGNVQDYFISLGSHKELPRTFTDIYLFKNFENTGNLARCNDNVLLELEANPSPESAIFSMGSSYNN